MNNPTNENISMALSNVDALTLKAEEKRKLLKLVGWDYNNIGEEATDLLINSIEGKLQIIKSFQENKI